MKLWRPAKVVLIGIATLGAALFPFLACWQAFRSAMLSLIPFHSQPSPGLGDQMFCIISLVYFVVVAFYVDLVNRGKTTASATTRLLWDMGIIFLPFIAMPACYLQWLDGRLEEPKGSLFGSGFTPDQPSVVTEAGRRPGAVALTVLALIIVGSLQFALSYRFTDGFSSISDQWPLLALALVDLLIHLVIAVGYWDLKKWSVIVYALYGGLSLVTSLTTGRLSIAGPAAIVILLSMIKQWRQGVLS